jgi:hypothetical protein
MEAKEYPEQWLPKEVTRVEVICMDAGALIKEQLKSRNTIASEWLEFTGGTSDLQHPTRESSAFVVGNMHN